MDQQLPVSRLLAGESGIITVIKTEVGNMRRKLAVFGILPGVKIKLLQTVPVYVLELGYTQVAVDAKIASAIFVRKETS